MIENVANTMKKLGSVVIDCHSDSEKSDNSSESQQKRLERLKPKRVDSQKQKRHNAKENGVSDETQDIRKRGLEAT